MIQVASFDDEVSQEVIRMPKEQNVVLLRRGLRESKCRKDLCRGHKSEGNTEREKSTGVELEGRLKGLYDIGSHDRQE